MTRLIDADALKLSHCKECALYPDECMGKDCDWGAIIHINEMPTIDAVPTEFIMENCNFDFVCDALTDDSEWCAERCQYSEPQPECIHRYIDRIWRKEHDTAD